MIKKSFQTIFKNPKVLIAFAIMILVPTIIYALFSMTLMPDWMMQIMNLAEMDDISDPAFIQFWLSTSALWAYHLYSL